MRQGFIPVGVCVPELVLGDPTANAETHVKMIQAALHHGTKILVFPELSLTGATLEDLFRNRRLMENVEQAIEQVVEATAGHDLVAVFGAPVATGGKLYDCAVVAGNGHIHAVVPKTHIQGSHARVFAPAPQENTTCVLAGMQVPFGTKILLESLFAPQLRLAVELGEDTAAPIPPAASHALAGATVIASLTAAKNTAGGPTLDGQDLRHLSRRLACAYLRSDAGRDESVSGGMCLGHVAVAENGEMLKEDMRVHGTIVESEVDVQLLQAARERRAEFREGDRTGYETLYFGQEPVVTTLTRKVPQGPFLWDESGRDGWCDTIMQMQVDAIVRRLESTGASAVVVPMDGGVASAVAAYGAARAVNDAGHPTESVICVICKGPGLSSAAANRAMTLSECIKTSMATLDITEQFDARMAMLGVRPEDDPELAQDVSDRIRRGIAMDLAEQVGGIVLNTDDMTDWAMGRAKTPSDPDTFAVNAGIPKTAMRFLLLRIQEKEDDFRRLSNVIRAVLVEDGGKVNPGRGQDIRSSEQVRITDMQVNDLCLYYSLRYGFSPNKTLRLADAAFGESLGEATLYKYVAAFFRSFMANRVLHASVPDGPRYLPVDLRDEKLNGDFFEDLWESELHAMAPAGMEDIDAAAEQEIRARDELEAEKRREQEDLLRPTEEVMAEMERASQLARREIERERADEEARHTTSVGKKMDGFEMSPEEARAARKVPDMQEDPAAFFEAMRRQAEEQIRREREAEQQK